MVLMALLVIVEQVAVIEDVSSHTDNGMDTDNSTSYSNTDCSCSKHINCLGIDPTVNAVQVLEIVEQLQMQYMA